MSWITGCGAFPFLAVLAPAVVGDVGHRAGTVERDGGDQVLEPVGAHLPQRVAHALAFHLEHPAGIAFLQHLEGLGVVERQAVEVDRDVQAFQEVFGAAQDGQRGQAEKVEFDQAGLFDMLHRILRDQEVGFRVAVERHQFDQRAVADDDAGGVGGGVAIQALDAQGDFQQAADAFVFVAQGLQPGLAVHRLLQRDRLGGIVRDQFGDFVDLAEGQAEHAADVADGGAGLQFSEGDDLGDAVAAVFVADIVDDAVAAFLAEVDVEVGHRHAFGVEEALEQQVEAQRVEVGDGQCPGGDRTGAGAAAGADRDALRLRPLDEVGDDQEVAGEAHAGDDDEFVVQAGAVDFAGGGVGAGGVHAAFAGPPSPWRGRFLPRSGRGGPWGRPAAAACGFPP